MIPNPLGGDVDAGLDIDIVRAKFARFLELRLSSLSDVATSTTSETSEDTESSESSESSEDSENCETTETSESTENTEDGHFLNDLITSGLTFDEWGPLINPIVNTVSPSHPQFPGGGPGTP